ncbi:hypothetical protein LCGC14_1706470, partial [marine sediment metagenome]
MLIISVQEGQFWVLRIYFIINIIGIIISFFYQPILLFFGIFSIVTLIVENFYERLTNIYLSFKLKKGIKRFYNSKIYEFLPNDTKMMIYKDYRTIKQFLLLFPTEQRINFASGALMGVKINLDFQFCSSLKNKQDIFNISLDDDLSPENESQYKTLLIQEIESGGTYIELLPKLRTQYDELFVEMVLQQARKFRHYDLLQKIMGYILLIWIISIILFIVLGIIFFDLFIANIFLTFILKGSVFVHLFFVVVSYTLLQIQGKVTVFLSQMLNDPRSLKDMDTKNMSATIDNLVALKDIEKTPDSLKIAKKDLLRNQIKGIIINSIALIICGILFFYFIKDLLDVSAILLIFIITVFLYIIPSYFYYFFIIKLHEIIKPFFDRPKFFSIYKVDFQIYKILIWTFLFGFISLIFAYAFQVKNFIEFSLIISSIILITFSLLFIWSSRENLKISYIFITVKIRKRSIGLIYTGIIFFLIFFVLLDYLTGSNLYSFEIPNFLEDFPINIPQIIIFFVVFYIIFFFFIKRPFQKGIKSLQDQYSEISEEWVKFNIELIGTKNIAESKEKINRFVNEKKVRKIKILI